MAVEYLVQEEDGVSRITLEDGTGALLLEESDLPPGAGAGDYMMIHHHHCCH